MLRRLSSRRALGFSIIELMITLVIMAIALSIGVHTYSIWMQNSQIRLAAESVGHGMQRARAEAVVRNTPVVFTLGGAAFWTVSVVSDGSVIESRPLGEVSNNVTLTVLPGGATTVTFGNLGTVTAAGITQIDFDSAVLSASDSRNLRLAVGAGGVARMCDPGVSDTTDPRHC